MAIYIDFFTHHCLPDARPLLLGWFLVAAFIWFAENVGTFTRTWAYPGQHDGWALVSPTKLSAWYLLMIISFVLVSLLHRPEPRFRDAKRQANKG